MPSKFTLIGFTTSCDRSFTLEIDLDAPSAREAAATLGCGFVDMPALESAIIRDFIETSRRRPAFMPLLLQGRPNIIRLVRLAPHVDGRSLVALKDSWRVFISPGTLS